jgi:hypothetical protein
MKNCHHLIGKVNRESSSDSHDAPKLHPARISITSSRSPTGSGEDRDLRALIAAGVSELSRFKL